MEVNGKEGAVMVRVKIYGYGMERMRKTLSVLCALDDERLTAVGL